VKITVLPERARKAHVPVTTASDLSNNAVAPASEPL
jgi:hypothetical protein